MRAGSITVILPAVVVDEFDQRRVVDVNRAQPGIDVGSLPGVI